ncbi:unnamed protein product [Triticum turgidum subsp. durum]|uniref:Flotillin-like n=1 Tax=Triticum turgidum subsp. durum TaxID=4567 RepID=A0A9R1QZJ3_TRITD|nr:unnamed protein product [Triticum turgidum subsp. durum]
MSSEKLPFVLPAVFTIGPQVTTLKLGDAAEAAVEAKLLLYAKLIAPLHLGGASASRVHDLVKGVIEGETRVLAAQLTMDEIFTGTKMFKKEVFDSVQKELDQFGLFIYNANVKQLVDVPGHEYFSYLGQKTQQEAASRAKVDVAEARMKGKVGAKERTGLTLQNAAKVDAETKVLSVRQQGEALKEELAMKKAGWDRQAKVAEVEAAKAVAIRDAELQMEVEIKNALCQTEKLKAEQLSKATVQYDTQVQESNALFYGRQKAAEAALYEEMKAAEARKAQADALFFEQKMAEDAKLYAKQREAEALSLVGRAKADYVASMLATLGGDYRALRDYLMIDGGMYAEMARINASAVNGLRPKISVWSNGDGGGEGGALQQVAGVYKMLPPLPETVHEQTGMLPPAWMGTLSKDGAAAN